MKTISEIVHELSEKEVSDHLSSFDAKWLDAADPARVMSERERLIWAWRYRLAGEARETIMKPDEQEAQ